MKPTKLKWTALAAGLAASAACGTTAQAQTSDPALNALIKKGILTEQEAKAALAEKEEQAKKAKPADSDVRVFWKDGLNFQSADGKTFKGKLGGRLDIGLGLFSEDKDVRTLPGVGDIPAGVEFRRARLYLEGEYVPSGTTLNSFYKLEFDFTAAAQDAADAKFSLKDVYAGVGGLPGVGTVQVGHFKEPISLEILTSSRFLTFIERALPVEAFAPERNTGVMLYNSAFDERLTWAAGAFTDVGDSGNGTTDVDYRFDGRVAGLPWYDEESKGAKLFHLGVSGSYIKPQDELVRYRTRPEAHQAPRFVDTRVGTTAAGDIPSDQTWLAAGEAALVYGPFSVQGEYLRTWVNTLGGENVSFDGFYVFGSWFITGEHRVYKRSNCTFDRIRPNKNLSLSGGGLGAWELAARYSTVDLNHSAVKGGRLNDVTGGLNWYLNPNMKIQFNYTWAMVDRTVSGVNHDGEAHIFQTLLHVDF